MPRKICIITGTRAEFGLLETVMRAVKAHRKLELQTVVAGAHFLTGTWRDVETAGFTIDAKVRMQTKTQVGRAADAAALGRGVSGFAKVFGELKPDVVLVLGDRIEIFAAASAAAVAGIRVAHLHGGDRAEGVADESLRHATSKLAHLHFPATKQSRDRLIAMGEDKRTIFTHGSPAIDALRGVEAAADAPEVIVLQHPIGAPDADEQKWMAATLKATEGYRRLVFAPNHDPGRDGILAAIHAAGIDPIQSLPRAHWLSLLKGANVLVGNTSAGLIEAAALKTPAINLGPRQAGRERPPSVIDAKQTQRAITTALQKALSLDKRKLRHPYGQGDTGAQIAQTLAAFDEARIPVRKQNTY